MDGVDDLLPGLHLLLTPDPGDVGEHFSLRRDSGGFCDQKGRGSSKERALLTAREVTSRLYGTALEMMVGPFITQVLYKLAEQGELGFTAVGGPREEVVCASKVN